MDSVKHLLRNHPTSPTLIPIVARSLSIANARVYRHTMPNAPRHGILSAESTRSQVSGDRTTLLIDLKGHQEGRDTFVDHDRQSARGTYLLTARLDQPTPIIVGRLGTFSFPAGWYTYAGSALGPGGLEARLARHLRTQKRLHWHVDYLLQHSKVETIWQITSPARLECAWAAAIHDLPGAATPAPGFGASDCRCSAHLVYFCERPGNRLIAEALRKISPESHGITLCQAGTGNPSP
jgi:Uri superfamily endonuclease